MNICYVTAYVDIGRKDWTTFARSSTDYISHFLPFIGYFRRMNAEERIQSRMIVFIDDAHHDALQERLPPDVPILLIRCTPEYLSKHIHGWSYLDIEERIIKSDNYKKIVGDRVLKYPENYNPKYTTLTNCKVDFVVHAMSMSNAPYLCWVDFGYFKLKENIPERSLDISKLNCSRINIQLLQPLDTRDCDIVYTMRYAPERVAGAFVFGPRGRFLEYQQLHHAIHEEFHTLGLVDDDQHIALRCYFRRPELFQLHVHYWSKSLIVFQKTD